MSKILLAASAAVFSLAMLACSNDNVTGSSEDPNVDVAEKTSSSRDDVGLSSSSVEQTLSSSGSLVLCKAGGSTSGCVVTSYGDLWAIGYTRVATKSIAKDSSKYGDRAGELFFETDSIEGGKTQITWDDGGSNPRITEFGMGYLSAIVSLDKGDMDKEPYVNIGFNVAGFDSNGMPISADISDWNGICISYVASVDVSLLLDLGDSVNQKIDFAMPSITLEKGRSTQCFEWKQFVQDESKKEHDIISGENAAKHVVNILFHVQSSENVVGFEIVAIGTNRDE
ncbi:MAG: hypothetical protein J6Y14_01650 [Fibrobacter sp.]|nr:hypothetical protein [Fibrobacter sp.]